MDLMNKAIKFAHVKQSDLIEQFSKAKKDPDP